MLTNSHNMLPCGANYDQFDRFLVHTKLPCQRAHAYAVLMLLANIAHILLGQSRLFYGFTSWPSFWMHTGMVLIATRQAIRMGTRSMSSLCCHVGHIIGVSSQKQMIGPNTRGVIARVANLYSRWDFSMYQLPHNAVRKALAITRPYLPISFVVAIASPQPAGIGFANLRPQSIFNGACVALISARAAAMNLAGIVSREGARAVGAGFVVYNSHVGSSFQAIGHATAVSAARGFLVPNYTTKPNHQGACL